MARTPQQPAHAPRSDRAMFHVKHSTTWSRLRTTFLLLAAALLFEACTVSRNPISGNKRAYGYTWQQEIQIGQESDPQIVAQFGLLDNRALAEYVERIGQEVLAESHLREPDAAAEFRNTPFTFRVLDSPVVNAFALPGGYVYVTRGLLTHLANEAQLAVVLGHEITHVAGRHASKRAAEAQLSQFGLLGGAVLGGVLTGSGNVAEGILNVGSQGLQLMLLSNSRDDERESDTHGVAYAAQAGYAAGEGAAFFESLDRLQERAGGGIPSWQSSHPDPYEREQRILELAAEWQQRLPGGMDRVAREQYLSLLDGTVLGENPRHGFVENNTFYHPDLAFAFPVPSDFALDNQNRQVVMQDRNGGAALVFSSAPAIVGQEVSSARAAVQVLAGQEGVQVGETGSATSNGLPAHYAVLQVASQNQTVRILAYFIEYGGSVWGFLGYSTPDGFSRYQDTFLRTMRGFGRLTNQTYLNVQPTRVDIVAAPRTAPFQSFLPRTLPRGITAEEMAIINQVTLEQTIERGRMLKLPAN